MNIYILLIQAGGGLLSTFLVPLILMVGIFYLLVLLPQKKQQQKLKDLIEALSTGDEIVTNGGIIGKIVEVRETSFVIRSADKSLLEIGRAAVVGKKHEEVAEKK